MTDCAVSANHTWRKQNAPVVLTLACIPINRFRRGRLRGSRRYPSHPHYEGVSLRFSTQTYLFLTGFASGITSTFHARLRISQNGFSRRCNATAQQRHGTTHQLALPIIQGRGRDLNILTLCPRGEIPSMAKVAVLVVDKNRMTTIMLNVRIALLYLYRMEEDYRLVLVLSVQVG